MLAQDMHTMKDSQIAPTGAVSPALAAEMVGRHRTTIVRAIEAGELRAVRRNNRHWSIMISDLEEWHGGSVSRAAPGPEAAMADKVADLEALLAAADRRYRELDGVYTAARDREDAQRELVELERGRVTQLTAELASARVDLERLGREREAAVAGQAAALASVDRLTVLVERQTGEIAERDARWAEREAELKAQVETEREARAETAKVATERAAELKRLKGRAWWERLLNR